MEQGMTAELTQNQSQRVALLAEFYERPIAEISRSVIDEGIAALFESANKTMVGESLLGKRRAAAESSTKE